MAKLLKKLVAKAGKKLTNKLVDKAFGSIFGKNRGAGRVFGFGGMEHDKRFAENPDLLSYRTIFHDQLTNEWAFQTPNRSLWYLEIDNLPNDIETQFDLDTFERSIVNDRVAQMPFEGNQAAHLRIVDVDGQGSPNSRMMKNVKGNQNTGCLFAQGVSIPQESMSFERTNLTNHRGFIQGLVAMPRNDFMPLVIEFRETNTSFIDTVIRPWIILASHRGLVSRAPGDLKNIKSDITITQLGLEGRSTASSIRKQFRFYNCVPYQSQPQNATYDTDQGSVPPIDTSWVYSHYSMKIGTGGTGASDPTMEGFGSIPSDFDGRSIA